MLRLVLAFALTIGAPTLARAQADADFQIIRDWDADDAKTESVQDTLRLIDGTIRTPRAYADFAFRFEYRPAAPGGSATLLLRSSVDGDRNLRSYEVALDRTPERGRLGGIGQVLHEGPFQQSAAVGDTTTWIAGEVRAESDRVRVVLDGITVATADRAEALSGTIGFRAGQGGVELRGMRVAVLSPQPAASALSLAMRGSSTAQTDGEFQAVRDWNSGGGKAETTADTLLLKSGTLWTPRAYADFVFRFEYRTLRPDSGGTLLLRANTWGKGIEAYVVTIDRSAHRGRLTSMSRNMQSAPRQPSAPIADASTWIACEVRADGERLTVSMDGVPIASADRADGLVGRIGFRVARGGLELRGMRLAPIGAPPASAAGLPRAGDPGVTTPTVIRSAQPEYTRAAMDAKVQGVVRLEFVVGVDGGPSQVRVLQSLHPDLDVAAVACLRRWRFKAATKDGAPTASVATMELSFKLK